LQIFVGEFDFKNMVRVSPVTLKDKQEAGTGLPEVSVLLEKPVRRDARQVIGLDLPALVELPYSYGS
jgi:hypothetical protein